MPKRVTWATVRCDTGDRTVRFSRSVVSGGKAWVEYTLVGGGKGQVSAETMEHVSLLSDGRGVIYIKAGGLIVVADGALVLEQWRQAGSTNQRAQPPECAE